MCWIDAHENLILCGPTGIAKSWLASALGHKTYVATIDLSSTNAFLNCSPTLRSRAVVANWCRVKEGREKASI
jgi:replication-associated recombination protein RarA